MRRDSVAEKKFLAAIWLRDRGRDRCTGQRLERLTDDWNRLGDVAHILAKSTSPQLRYATSNACLLSRASHILSDGRGGYLLKIEGDADGELTFRRYARDGTLLWTRVSPCPIKK